MAETTLAAAPPARRGRPGEFVAAELRLVFGRRRNQLALLVLAGPPLLITIAMKTRGTHADTQGGPAFLDSITQNGLFVALAALSIEMGFLLPLATALVAGDSIAGEAQTGTLRYLLTVPVGRTRLLLVKYAGVVVYVAAGALVVSAVGMLSGLAAFGGGTLTTLSGTAMPMGTAVVRVLLATAYLAAGMSALGAVGLFVSTLTEHPLAAMLVTVIVSTASFILDEIPQVDWLHPYLLTHQWAAYADLFRDPVATTGLAHGLYTDAAWAVVALLLARARFTTADITS